MPFCNLFIQPSVQIASICWMCGMCQNLGCKESWQYLFWNILVLAGKIPVKQSINAHSQDLEALYIITGFREGYFWWAKGMCFSALCLMPNTAKWFKSYLLPLEMSVLLLGLWRSLSDLSWTQGIVGRYPGHNQSQNISVHTSKPTIRPSTAAISSERVVESVVAAKWRDWKENPNMDEAGEQGLVLGVLISLKV